MRYLFSAIICLFSALAIVSCNEEPQEEQITLNAATGDATHISCRNAVLAGQALLPASTGADLKIGVLYSTGSGVLYGSATAVEAKTFDLNYNFTVTVGPLEPETTYYYRSFIFQNSEVIYGETKSFTTSALYTLIQTQAATDVDASIATLHGHLNLEDCDYKTMEYGFKVKPEGGSEQTLPATNLEGYAYSLKAQDLLRDKKYEVFAYVTLDGQTYTGEKQTFTTQTVAASVTLNEVTNITEYKATISGKVYVYSEGQYKTSANLVYSDVYSSEEDLLCHGVVNGLVLQDDGSFTTTLNNLKPNTKYYFMVIAGVDGNDFKTGISEFTTYDYTATFSTLGSESTEHNAILKASVSVDSKEEMGVYSVWFLYSDTASDATSLKTNGKLINASQSTNGEWTANVTNLKVATQYHFIAVAQVGGKEIVSEVQHFSTGSIYIQAVLLSKHEATESSLVLNGKVINNMQESLSCFQTSFKVCYSTTETIPDHIANSGNSIDVSLNSNNEFSCTIANLASNTTLNCMVLSTIDGTQVLGEVRQFSTAKVDATVATLDAAEVKYTAAKLCGTLNVNSTQNLNKLVWFCISDSASTLEDLLKPTTKQYSPDLKEDGVSFEVPLNDLNDGTKYYYVACAEVFDTKFYGEIKTFTTLTIPEGGVDLGLSVIWHQQNLGATSSDGYGDYYAWGELEPKTSYNWETYKWGTINDLQKYNTLGYYGNPDNITRLEPEDDVAHVKLGGNWHIPTQAEWQELLNNCSTKLGYNGSSYGYWFTSNINKNKIFLPFSGHIINSTKKDVGSVGEYTSADLLTDYPAAAVAMIINQTNPGSISNAHRFQGIPVRPVY